MTAALGRLSTITSHFVPAGTSSNQSPHLRDDDREEAFRKYCEDGRARAVALGNRGPVRFDADGRLASDILNAYWRHGFYVFEGVVSSKELQELRDDFEALKENAPANYGSATDRYGHPVKHPNIYQWVRPLSDPFGGTNFGVFNFKGGETKGRHPMKMREPVPQDGSQELVVNNMARPLLHMDSALRVYGHPDLLHVAEALNGPDFTPFTETLWYKPAGTGSSTAWHSDPSAAWDEEWSKPGFDVGTCGFSYHVSLFRCTAENALWIVPGSHHGGRPDVNAIATSGGAGDMLPGAVPIICNPGDVYLQNRLPLHGAFPNVSPEPRCTIQFGFHRRASVLGLRTQGYGGTLKVYDEDYIRERSKMIMLAIDARRQRYPHEVPYVYAPLLDSEEECRWSEELKESGYWHYWEKDIVI